MWDIAPLHTILAAHPPHSPQFINALSKIKIDHQKLRRWLSKLNQLSFHRMASKTIALFMWLDMKGRNKGKALT